MNSSLHQAHVAYHVQGFASIEQIQGDLIFGKYELPPFLSLVDKPISNSADKSASGGVATAVSWKSIASSNQVVASHGVPKSFNFKQPQPE